MATKTLSPLEAAQRGEAAARRKLDDYRAAILRGDEIDPVAYGAAGHELEVAELERQAAEAAETERRRKARLAALARLRKEIGAAADPAAALKAFEMVSAGIEALVRAAGPERNRRLAGWLRQLQALEVAETVSGTPSAEDGGIGWRGASWSGGECVLLGDGRVVRAVDLRQVIDGAIVAGCRAAGVRPAVAGVAGSAVAPGLVQEPATWIRARF